MIWERIGNGMEKIGKKMVRMGEETVKMGNGIKFKINGPMSGEERCCGDCCWFKHEDTDGWGVCYGSEHAIGYHIGDEGFPRCNQAACDKYVSNKQMRHHMAVLLQANRYRRDQHVPSIYKMPNPKELGKAIDFAVEYMRMFEKI